MRSDKNICKALQDVNFEDGKCHFRKESKYGPNLYDAEKNRRVR
jgi:hypothetical protein